MTQQREILWGVHYLKQALSITTPMGTTELPFSRAFDGCVGVIPVFATREEALVATKGDESLIFPIGYKEEQVDTSLFTPVASVFSPRIANALRRNDINFVEEINVSDLPRRRWLGKKSIQVIKEYIEERKRTTGVQ